MNAKMQIHQFHGVVAYGDAIGNDILALQASIRHLGYDSEIFAEVSQRRFEARVRHYSEYRRFSSPSNLLLCHFSIGYSPAVLAWLRRIPDRKILVYHNITPASFFSGISNSYYQAALNGRAQLSQLSALTIAGWGVSDFNRQELVERGWTNTDVLPIVFDPALYSQEPDAHLLKQYSHNGGVDLLSVSRLAPNKKVEDVILTFYYLKKFIEPRARLFLIGSADQMERYVGYLQALIRELGLSDVLFTEHVSRKELFAFYHTADAYLCMSEHEGFGVPLVESMYFNVPVIAYAAAAVPETLGQAGVLVKRKDHQAIAEIIHLLAHNIDLRSQIIQTQQSRWKEFTPEVVEARLRGCLEAIL